jgi:hypothetical protein
MSKKLTSTVAVLLMLGTSAFSKKKINPDDFLLQVKVTDVTSSQQASTIYTSKAFTFQNASTPFQQGYNAAARGRSTSRVRYSTVYDMRATIGDNTYDLQGPRLELGSYEARFAPAKRHRPAGIEVLMQNKKGKNVAVWFLIAGEHQK